MPETNTEADLIEIPAENQPKKARIRKKYSGKRISLAQLSKKKFKAIPLEDQELVLLLGELSGAFDIIFMGESGSGKSNLVARVVKALVLATGEKCDYVSYEEGHEATTQKTLIHRHNLQEELGASLGVWDHLTYEELVEVMSKRKSPKIWVIDSIQTAPFTIQQTKELRKKFVLGKKQKIIIWVSWARGDNAKGAIGESVQYWAHVKILVKGKIAFPISSRFGGHKPLVVWEGDETSGALGYWGDKYWKVSGQKKPKKQSSKPKTKANDDIPSNSDSTVLPMVEQ